MRRRQSGRARRAARTGVAALLLSLLALPAAGSSSQAAGASPQAAGAAVPHLAVAFDRHSLTVGDRVSATLTLTADPGTLDGEPRFPAWGKAWGPAEILRVSPVESRKAGPSRVAYRQTVVLTAFRPGPLPLPPRKVAVPGAGATRELATPGDLSLTVESVLPATPPKGAAQGSARGSAQAIPRPKPPAPPRALPLGRAFWWTLAVLGLAAAGAVGLAVAGRRSGTRTPAGARRSLPPAQELAASLQEVAREKSLERAHVALSAALRRYLGRSLGFAALESTTSEIRGQLRGRRAPERVAARSVEVLGACDRVKFAREPSARTALEARIGAAREIADRLEAYLAPAPAAASAPPAPPTPPGAAGRPDGARGAAA